MFPTALLVALVIQLATPGAQCGAETTLMPGTYCLNAPGATGPAAGSGAGPGASWGPLLTLTSSSTAAAGSSDSTSMTQPVSGTVDAQGAFLQEIVLDEILEHLQPNATASGWVPCDEEELQLQLAACSRRVPGMGSAGSLEYALWANFTCTGAASSPPPQTAGLVASITLPLAEGGSWPQAPADVAEVVSELEFVLVEPSSSPSAANDSSADNNFSVQSATLKTSGDAQPQAGLSGDGWAPEAPTNAAPAPPQAPPVPAAPGWAKGPDFHGPAAWKNFSTGQYQSNLDIVEAANAAGVQYDYVQYGDSITILMEREGRKLWQSFFPPAAGWSTQALGVAGADIQDLAYRLAHGELPAVQPKSIGVLIGTNNINQHDFSMSDHKRKVSRLLDWLAEASPTSRLLLLGLLPNAQHNVQPVNDMYRSLAQQKGVAYTSCGDTIDPHDPTLLYDGTHPALAGQQVFLECLVPVVESLVR